MNQSLSKNSLLYALGAIIILTIVWYYLSPSNAGDISQYQQNEAIYKHELSRLAFEVKRLKSKDSVLTDMYSRRGDTLRQMEVKTTKVKIIYREVRAATEANPDSVNLYNEVVASRVLIYQQEEHIKAFTRIQHTADSLLAVRAEIMKGQEAQLALWPERFENQRRGFEAQLRKEHKKGAGKLFKGFLIGAVVMGALAL